MNENIQAVNEQWPADRLQLLQQSIHIGQQADGSVNWDVVGIFMNCSGQDCMLANQRYQTLMDQSQTWNDVKLERLKAIVQSYQQQNQRVKWPEVAKVFKGHSADSCKTTAYQHNFVQNTKVCYKWTEKELSDLENLIRTYVTSNRTVDWEDISLHFAHHSTDTCKVTAYQHKFIAPSRQNAHWYDFEVALLKQLLDARNPQQQKIDWEEISAQIGSHSANACKAMAYSQGYILEANSRGHSRQTSEIQDFLMNLIGDNKGEQK